MFTFSWLKSEPTVLLWGDRWWLPQSKLPVPFADFSQAADALAAVWPFPCRTFRLIYQPDHLATAAVRCPHGNRTTLALALGDEFPALQHPAHVWGFEPILPVQESFGTLLHYETEPGLFSLVQQLHRHGLHAKSVWPLATWLNALPPELTDSGALSVVALHHDRYCLYRQSAAGGRSIHAVKAADVVAAVADQLRDAAAQNDTEFVLFVSTDDSLLARVEERVALAPNQIVGTYSLWEALAKRGVIPEKHPAQLLPPLPLVTWPRAAGTATILLLLGALGFAAGHGWRHHTAREQARSVARETMALREEIQQRRAETAEVIRLRAALGDAEAKAEIPELLRALGAAARPGLVLQAVHATESGFTLRGAVAPDGHDAWARWSRAVADAAVPWVADCKPPDAAGNFAVQGRFRP